MSEKLDINDIFGENVGEPEKKSPRSTNSVNRRRAKAEKSHTARDASPFALNVGKYQKSDADRTDWDVEDFEPGSLPDISKIRDAFPGFTFRWIRTILEGKSDSTRVSQAINEGWQPVMADDIPKGVAIPNFELDGVGTAVGLSGLLLCMMPTARHDKMKAHEVTEAENNLGTIGNEIRSIGPAGTTPLRSLKTDVRRLPRPNVQG